MLEKPKLDNVLHRLVPVHSKHISQLSYEIGDGGFLQLVQNISNSLKTAGPRDSFKYYLTCFPQKFKFATAINGPGSMECFSRKNNK